MSVIEAMKNSFAKLLQSSEAITNEVKRVRDAMHQKKRDLQDARDRPVPLVEARSRVPAVVAAIGADWLKDRCFPLLHDGGPSSFHRALASPKTSGHVSLPRMEPWWPILCAGDPERAEAILCGLLERAAYTAGSPSSLRGAEVARLSEELAALEASEEEMVDAAIAAGVALQHREEVVVRRGQEANQAARTGKEIAALEKRQDAIDAQHANSASRMPQMPSDYVDSEGIR